jgi:hypothetical protein
MQDKAHSSTANRTATLGFEDLSGLPQIGRISLEQLSQEWLQSNLVLHN